MEERQLDIFKTKRQKGKLPPGPSEFQIHCTVADYLRHGIAPGWSWFHPPNGGERPAIYRNGKRVSPEGGRLKRMGALPGVSDILLIKAPHAQLHALELKAKGEKPSDEQVAWMTQVVMLGGVVAYADTVDEAMGWLRQWGAIRTSIHT